MLLRGHKCACEGDLVECLCCIKDPRRANFTQKHLQTKTWSCFWRTTVRQTDRSLQRASSLWAAESHSPVFSSPGRAAEQAGCCRSSALKHRAITFIDFLFDGIIWSLYLSQMKWSSALLVQRRVQGPFSNAVNCIRKESMILSRWQYHSFNVT